MLPGVVQNREHDLPEHQSPDPEPAKPSGPASRPASGPASGTATPQYQDRIYRSPAGLAGGVLLLGVIGWLGVDAVVAGEGRTPWLALAAMLLLLPLIIAYTLRPAVFVNDDRLRVRNPFRVIVLPWGRSPRCGPVSPTRSSRRPARSTSCGRSRSRCGPATRRPGTRPGRPRGPRARAATRGRRRGGPAARERPGDGGDA
ncbi:hypothetical protein SHKM778_12130 [Streptomyces sp. KM77-8]|uniref:Low molecular weight protein antigen 6 PH domain-containing protein n=1 Tax=Streptomyces haneummycinicus TaxID=3074435 RepID=A0AAT9HBY8_9ACTN